MRSALGLNAFLLLASAAAQTGLDWYAVPTGNRPPGRWSFDMAYDSLRHVTVLYNGGTVAIDDMWIFDGTNWQQQFPTVRPPVRSIHAMAYDSGRDRVVLFGGFGFGSPFGRLQDTWEWDGSQWAQRAPANMPPPRSGHRLAYDAARQRVVLFGGEGNNGAALTDTWEWDGNDWLLRTPANAPQTYTGHAMAHDQARQRVVLFGGWFNGLRNETWEWDGTDWLQRTPAVSPPARGSGSMAYDLARGAVVLFGGSSGLTTLADTWLWNGTDWQQVVTTSAPGRTGHVLVHENARNRTLMFGGTTNGLTALDDTWALADLIAPPSFESFGMHCPGGASGVAPMLQVAPDALPWLGTTFAIDLVQLPPDGFSFMMLGFSDVSYWHLRLPAELSSFLMPGCWLYTDIVDATYLTISGGTARYALAIPPDPTFEGLRLLAQGMIHDPQANARGFITSNASAAVLGSWR